MRWLKWKARGGIGNESSFAEQAYLDANPDVRAAVRNGSIASGYEHYRRAGRLEGRPLDASGGPRKQLLLKDLDLRTMAGVEIGALDKPLVSKADGDVTYVDYADTAFLKDHYANDGNVDCARIVHVDAIWGKDTLRQAVGETRQYDYVLASHVIEHVPDLVTWLQEIRSVLKLTGSLRLAVPDKRFTFDYVREVSSICDLLDAHVRRARAPLPRMILDFCLQARHVNTLVAWQKPLDPTALERHFTDQDAISIARDAHENGTYHDIHCWVFTPRSFCETMARLSQLQLMEFACRTVVPTKRNSIEFYVQMVPCESAAEAEKSWADAARTAERAS